MQGKAATESRKRETKMKREPGGNIIPGLEAGTASLLKVVQARQEGCSY